MDIEVVAPAEIALEPLFDALHRAGFRVIEGGQMRVVVTPSPFESGLGQLDAETRAQGRNWLMISVHGAYPWVGPLFTPEGAPCWRCLAGRMHINGHGIRPAEPADLAELAEVATKQLVFWERRHWSSSTRHLYVVSGTRLEQHPLIPACRDCAERTSRASLAARSLVSPFGGIVHSVRVEQASAAFFRARATCSPVRSPDSRGRLLAQPPELTGGKGTSSSMAQTSCLAEAVERYSLYLGGSERLLKGSLRSLGTVCLNPNQLLQFSARQHARRKWWLGHFGSFHWPPERFDEEAVIEWVEVRHAGTGAIRLVPAEYCFLGYGGRFAFADSNGCAAGRTRWEAARNALLELVERDAVSIWWYNRALRPAVPWRAFHSERLDGIAELQHSWNRNFWLLDITTDIGIPAAVAISANKDGAQVVLGSGAGLDPEAAAWRAAAEMCAHLVDLRGHCAPDDAGRNERELWRWWGESRLAEHPYLMPSGKKCRPVEGYQGPPRQEFEEARRRVESRKIEVFLYDHTRPELGIPVIRAIAPGLRHWWARFAPGRLYEAPRQMGWQVRSLSERELNPLPYFL